MIEKIGDLIRKAESDYNSGGTTISDYVQFSLKENVNKIDAYIFSKHISGDKDSLGRDKPFFNIVKAARNIWYRATNINRSKIRIKSRKAKNRILSFIGTILLQDWMTKVNFDEFLDKWGLSLATYNSSLTKFVEQNGELIPSIESWNRLICDSIQFEGNMSVIKLELTPAQLRKNKLYDQKQVTALLSATQARTTLSGQTKDNKDDYITIYEAHGELSEALLTGDEKDEDNYVQQIQVVSFVEGKNNGEFDDFILYKGKEKDPYLMTHLLKEDGRVMGVGAIEDLFDAQWMTNHSIKLIKDELDLASQMIFQTSDGSFVGRNILTSLQTGDVFVYADGKPLTQLANNPKDVSALQSFALQWQNLSKEISSTPDAVRGATQPSGTAFRTVAVENQEGKSLFEVFKRNKKRYLEEMFRRFIIPYIKKQMDTSEEIAAILESQDITQLDSFYVPNEARRRNNKMIKDIVLSGKEASNNDIAMLEQNVKNELSSWGNQRFIKPDKIPTRTWKEALKDLEWEVEVDIQDKDTDDQLVLQYLIDWFKIAANPTMQSYLQTPQGKLVSSKILERSNAISPIELASLPEPQQQPLSGGRLPVEQGNLQTIKQQ